MIKKLARFCFALFAAGILFSSCPMAYTPTPRAVTPLLASNWLNEFVNIPEDFTGELKGQAPGYQWWSLPYPGRNTMSLLTQAGRSVTVTFNFVSGQLSDFDIYYETESYQYPEIRRAINAWKLRVETHGISGITEPLRMCPRIPTADNPYRSYWGLPDAERSLPERRAMYVDAFSGATITVNALSRAARNALCRFIDGGADCYCLDANTGVGALARVGAVCFCNIGCDHTCDCTACTCTGCDGTDCEAVTLPCGTPGCVCSPCPGAAACHCTPPILHVTGIILEGEGLLRISQREYILNLVRGSVRTITAEMEPDNAFIQALLWDSSNPGVAGINRIDIAARGFVWTGPGSGIQITANEPGTSVIEVMALGGDGVRARVTVTVALCATPGCACTNCSGASCTCAPPVCDRPGCDCLVCLVDNCTCYGCRAPGCNCSDCIGDACDCFKCDHPGCHCDGSCTGDACTCNIITVTGRSGGFWYYEFNASGQDVTIDESYVEVTFRFEDGVLAEVTLNLLSPLPESMHYPGVYAAVRNWESQVQQGGIQAIPRILPYNAEDPMGGTPHRVTHPDSWSPEEVNAFTGGTFTVNSLTRAALDAIEQLPPGFTPAGFFGRIAAWILR